MLDKLINAFVIKNVKTGKPSYTTTMVIIGFGVINLKLLLAGMEITDKIKFSDFTGIDYAACLTAIGGIYLWNKKGEKKKEESGEE